MIDTGDIDVFLGLDVGKGEHHATAVTPAGKNAFGKRLLRCQSSCFLHVSVPACAPRSDDDHDAGRLRSLYCGAGRVRAETGGHEGARSLSP
ncbi:hypothetical protein [Streptomyces sp. NPDC027717]|uniref:hypothetical protein n=1 Tax=Streptomyces sp. NPDC027717 TaxID=3155765 RepID=UPI0033FBA8F7